MPEYPIKIFRHSRLSLSTHSCLFLSSYRSILLHALLLFNQLHVLLRLCKEILHQSILFKRQGSSSHDVLNLRSHHRIGQCAAHHHEYTGTQHILKVIYNELPDVVVHLLHKYFAFLCQLPMPRHPDCHRPAPYAPLPFQLLYLHFQGIALVYELVQFVIQRSPFGNQLSIGDETTILPSSSTKGIMPRGPYKESPSSRNRSGLSS